jgi:hypothetical protein
LPKTHNAARLGNEELALTWPFAIWLNSHAVEKPAERPHQ